ncbi:MAG: hypothetical protein JOZ82_10980, partial [Marmoricola sp.]|nr:hypothetical protein [Marmoricola sp.]
MGELEEDVLEVGLLGREPVDGHTHRVRGLAHHLLADTCDEERFLTGL